MTDPAYFSPDFPKVTVKHANLLMLHGLAQAAVYYEISDFTAKEFESMIISYIPDNDYAQRAAMAFFESITKDYNK